MFSEALAATGQHTQSLWAWLREWLYGTDIQLFSAGLVCVFAGLAANYFVKWSKGEIVDNLWCYLVHQSPRRTAYSLTACVGAVLAMFGSGAFWILDPGSGVTIFIGWGKALAACFISGYALDSAINKGERKVLTMAEREKVQAKAAQENHPGIPNPAKETP